MTDLMQWMYQNYIKPQIESQPKDDTEGMWFDFLDNELYDEQKKGLQAALAFYAVQGFRPGVRTGVTLGTDLS
ncbi:MAG: hypothetical protein HFF58_06245 [Lawsonibacter sp.]|nr:hypothetical protein [Lawsonibacter sp.]